MIKSLKVLVSLLITVFWIFTSCDGDKISNYDAENDCYWDTNRTRCDDASECISKFGENYLCEYSKNHAFDTDDCYVKYCLEDRCTAENIDCGYGTCVNDTLRYDCNCDEGTMYETTDIGPTVSDYIPMCIKNTCKSDSDCQIYIIEDGYKQWSATCSIEKMKCIVDWGDK